MRDFKYGGAWSGKTVVLAPNAFKGSLGAVEAARAMARGFAAARFPLEPDLMPIAPLLAPVCAC